MRVRKLTQILIINVVIVALLDLFLGFLLSGRPASSPRETRDMIMGWTVVPDHEITIPYPEHPDGRLTFRTNGQAVRADRDYERVKLPGSFRVVVVGDSYVEGVVNHRESFTAIVERLLNEASRQPVDVINGGLARFSPYQAYLRLKHELIKFGPDAVIVGVYVGNDFLDLLRRDDRPSLEMTESGFEHLPPRYLIYKEPMLPWWPDNGPVYKIYGLVFKYRVDRALLTRDLVSSLGGGFVDTLGTLLAFAKANHRGILSQTLAQAYYFRHYPHAEALALQIMEHVIRLHKELADRQMYALRVLIIPSRVQVEPDLDRAVLDTAYEAVGLNPEAMKMDGRLHRALKALLARLGVEYIDPLEDLRRASGKSTPLYWNGDYHLNVQGNRVIAEKIGDELRPLLGRTQLTPEGRLGDTPSGRHTFVGKEDLLARNHGANLGAFTLDARENENLHAKDL